MPRPSRPGRARFSVHIVEEDTVVGDLPAVILELWGQVHVTGRHEFWVTPSDPLAGGVLLR